MFRDTVTPDPWARCPAKTRQKMWVDHIFKIGRQDPFPNEAWLPLEKLEQLDCMITSRWLMASWRSVRTPDSYNVPLNILGRPW